MAEMKDTGGEAGLGSDNGRGGVVTLRNLSLGGIQGKVLAVAYSNLVFWE